MKTKELSLIRYYFLIPIELAIIFAVRTYPIRSETRANVGWGRTPSSHVYPEFYHPACPVLFDGRWPCRSSPPGVAVLRGAAGL